MNKPPSSQQTQNTEPYSYTSWHERSLRVVLQVACAVGFVAILFYLFGDSTRGIKLLAVITWGVLILITFTKLPYFIRAGVFLLLLYFASLSSLLDHKPGDAAVLFLGFVVMTGLLLPMRWAAFYAMGVSLLSFLIVGGEEVFSISGAISIVIFLVVSVIIAIGVRNSQEEFIRTQEATHQALDKLQSEHSTLEQRVEERTIGFNRKSEQLRATSYIARKTAEVQDLASLLEMVARLVTDQFGFYHTGVFLINETGDQAVLQAASSEGGRRMMERGHALSVGTQGIVGYVAAQRKPRIALDVGSDAVFFNNPDLPMTRSELALPLMVRNKVLGVLDIQSEKSQAFTPEDIDVLQTLSDQVAIAIENARLLDETQAALIQLEALTSLRTREAWGQKLHEKSRVFTYTPLGLRAERLPQNEDEAISAPIILRGQKIGNISIARKGEAAWSRLDKELLEEVASQVGLAVDNIRLIEDATDRAKQEQTIGKLATRFSQSLDLDTLLQTAARELGQLPDVSEVSVFIDQETQPTTQSKQRSKRNVS